MSLPLNPPHLHHACITAPGASPGRWWIFLHGIFGMGRNWTQFARQLVRVRPDLGAVLVDLRLHGHSRGFAPPHSLDACAADVEALSAQLSGSVCGVVGHSFGGKVALVLAERRQLPLERVFVLDSTPESGRSATPVMAVLQAMQAIPMPAPSRPEVITRLQAQGLSEPIAQWLATNVEGVGQSFVWRFDFAGLKSLIESFFQRDLWNVLEDPASPVIHMVKAARSDVLDPEAVARIGHLQALYSGRLTLDEVAQAGHWLHVDNPEALLELVLRLAAE